MGSLTSEQLSYWFDLYRDRLVLYARQWLGFDQAQDAVQEAYLRLMAQNRAPKIFAPGYSLPCGIRPSICCESKNGGKNMPRKWL